MKRADRLGRVQISHRYSNSAAMINAAFNFNLDSAGKTIKEARVVYGLPGASVLCLVDIAGEIGLGLSILGTAASSAVCMNAFPGGATLALAASVITCVEYPWYGNGNAALLRAARSAYFFALRLPQER